MGGRGASSGFGPGLSDNVNKIIAMTSGGDSSDSYFMARTTELDKVFKRLGISDWSEEASEIRSALARVSYTEDRKAYSAKTQQSYEEAVKKFKKLIQNRA